MSDIKAFPMDSRVTEMGEDGLPVYDRQFGSSDLREVMKTYFGDGYFAEEGTSMNVKASSGLDVTVQAGKVNMQGTLGYMDEDATVRLSNADKTYTRIDSVVARLDLSIDKRSIELYAKSGNASSSPSRPSLERTETVWELGLADVTLKAGVTEVTDADITDTRLDADRCGVAEPFAKLDTASLLEQVTAIVTQAQADVKADTDKLEKATGDAVSAMNDALSSTVLGSVWRLQSSSTSDYLAYGDDLNSIASVGTKFCDSTSVAGGIANKPADVTGPFSLATFATEQDPSRLGQVLMTCDASGVREYTRAGAGSSWSGWTNEAVRAESAEASLSARLNDIETPEVIFLKGSASKSDTPGYITYSVIGGACIVNMCWVEGLGDTPIATLPVGCRPVNRVVSTAVVLGTYTAGELVVEASGEIKIISSTTSRYWAASIMFPTA